MVVVVDDDDDCKDVNGVDAGTMNKTNAIYETDNKDRWGRNNGHAKGMVAHWWARTMARSLPSFDQSFASDIYTLYKYKQ